MSDTNQRAESTVNLNNGAGTDSQREAEEYVESIMGSQPVSVISARDEVSAVSRKRNLSAPSDTGTKKAKCLSNADGAASSEGREDENSDVEAREETGSRQDSATGRLIASARRSLYGRTPISDRNRDERDNGTKTKNSDHNISSDNMSTILQSLQNISSELKLVNTTLSERITTEVKKVNDTVSKRMNKLEEDLDKRLSDKLAQLVDKRVNNEMKKIRSEVDSRINEIRSDINAEIDELGAKVNSITDTMQIDRGSPCAEAKRLNVVVRNFPESVSENITEKVNNLIKNHIKVSDVTVSEANRLDSGSDSRPGVVIATFRSSEEKEKVMKAKHRLRSSTYKNVFIHNDLPKEERMMNSSLRAIVDAVNHGNSKLSVRGGRVVKNTEHSDRDRSNDNNGNVAAPGDNGGQNHQNQQNQNRNDNFRGRNNGFGRGNGNFRGGNNGTRGRGFAWRGGNNGSQRGGRR